MLSGIGISELLLLFVIGLLILGPERLPRVASQLGRWVGKARRTANQLRFQMEREIALADIERISKKKDEQKSGQPSGNNTEESGSTAGESADAGGQSSAATASGRSAPGSDVTDSKPAPADEAVATEDAESDRHA